jgi:hypothetical protein
MLGWIFSLRGDQFQIGIGKAVGVTPVQLYIITMEAVQHCDDNFPTVFFQAAPTPQHFPVPIKFTTSS